MSNDVVLKLLSEHHAQLADHSRAIWTLIVLSEWLEWLAGIKADIFLGAYPARFGAEECA